MSKKWLINGEFELKIEDIFINLKNKEEVENYIADLESHIERLEERLKLLVISEPKLFTQNIIVNHGNNDVGYSYTEMPSIFSVIDTVKEEVESIIEIIINYSKEIALLEKVLDIIEFDENYEEKIKLID